MEEEKGKKNQNGEHKRERKHNGKYRGKRWDENVTLCAVRFVQCSTILTEWTFLPPCFLAMQVKGNEPILRYYMAGSRGSRKTTAVNAN